MSFSRERWVKRLLALFVVSTYICLCHAGSVSPRRLVEVWDISNPVVSPDGTKIAFRAEQASVERNTYDSAWYVQDIKGASPPRLVADGGVPLRDYSGVFLPAKSLWSPDGRWIYFRALIDGKVDVWRAATDGSAAEPLTFDPADVRDFSLSTDGATLMYSVGASRDEVTDAERAEYNQGIRIDETVPVGEGLFRSGFVEGRFATQRLSGGDIARGPLLAQVPDRWTALDLASGARRSIERSAVPAALQTASDDTHESLPWKTTRDPRTGRVAELVRVGEKEGLVDKPDVELSVLYGLGSRAIKCSSQLCTNKPITNILWRPESGEVLFTVTDPADGNAQSIFDWDVGTGIVRPVVRTQGVVGGGGRYDPGECGISAAVLVCVAAEADLPPRLERIDLETGQRHVLFDPNAALALDLKKAAPTQLLRWKDSKGEEFTGQFFPAKVASASLPPLFVNYYSCLGFVRGGVGDQWPFASLAENGISALCINHAPIRTDAVERYDQATSAVESAVALLASSGKIDRTKVGMGGLSFGAETTIWTAMYSHVLSAASVTSTPVTPNYFLLMSMAGTPFRSRLRAYWQLGAPDETPARWRKLSPVFNLARIEAPVLMQLPEQEYIHSLDYAAPLLKQHRADLYVFPNEPHLPFQPRHMVAMYERNLDWFRFWLQGVEDPAPSKSAQYSHWREIRSAESKGAAH